MKPTLVILAAGIGSRFGGLKQLEKVGPGGAALMDYTIFDALKLGIGHVVMVIQRKSEEAIRGHIDEGAGRRVDVRYVYQDLSAIPDGFVVTPGRTKPWGTGQAVLAAASRLDRAFIVANADDFYGREALAALEEFLGKGSPDGLAHWGMVGFRLGDTLPPSGAVSRALCVQDVDGYLVSLQEVESIERDGNEAKWRDADGTTHSESLETLVSMNLWGFTHELIGHLEREFKAFLDNDPNPKDEYYLPRAVAGALNTGNARVSVLPTEGSWCGITSRADRTITEAVLRELVERGVYPEKLWD